MQATHIKCNIPPLPKTSNRNLADQTTQKVLATHYNPRPENKNQFLRACLNNFRVRPSQRTNINSEVTSVELAWSLHLEHADSVRCIEQTNYGRQIPQATRTYVKNDFICFKQHLKFVLGRLQVTSQVHKAEMFHGPIMTCP